MWMLKDIGVDWRDRNLIAKLYLGQKAVVRIDGELSLDKEFGKGVLYPHCCLISTSSMLLTNHA